MTELLALTEEPRLELRQPPPWKVDPGQARIWLWPLDPKPAALPEIKEILSGEEVARAGCFKNLRDERRFMMARAGLRHVLGQVLAEAPEALGFERGAHGKPRLWGQEGGEGLRFNLSHSGELAALVVARGAEPGIDIEEERNLPYLFDLVEASLNSTEQGWLLSRSEEERQSAFFKIWTLKESVLKADGRGLAQGMKSYTVLPQESGGARVQDYTSGKVLKDWKVSGLQIRGFQGALAFHLEETQAISVDSCAYLEYPC